MCVCLLFDVVVGVCRVLLLWYSVRLQILMLLFVCCLLFEIFVVVVCLSLGVSWFVVVGVVMCSCCYLLFVVYALLMFVVLVGCC